MTEHTSPPSSTSTQFPGAFELFSPSITAIGKNVGSFIGLLSISLGVVIVAALIPTLLVVGLMGSDDANKTAFIITLIAAITLTIIVAYAAMLPMFTYLQLRSSQGVKVSIGAVFRETKPYFWRLVGLRLLLGLLYFVGLLLLIAPFFFFWKRYMLSRYYVVDQNMGISEAMAASAADSKKYGDAIWGIVGVRTLWWFCAQIFGLVGSVVDFLYGCAPSLRYLQTQEAAHRKHK